MKNTTTWRLTYCKPFYGALSIKMFPSESRNIVTGVDEYLLSTGHIINRPPRQEAGQSTMAIPLAEVVTKYNAQTQQTEKYKSVTFEVAVGKIDTMDFHQKKILELNAIKLEFIKRSIYVSHKNYQGVQLNQNFPQDAQDYYILENLDEQESQKSALDEKIKTLGYDLVQIKKNPLEFNHLCYLFGVNISIMHADMAYNILSELLEKNPDAFAYKMNDPERWTKIVINKALRTQMPDSENNYITEETAGEFTNYYQNGKHIATGYDALLGYYKDNKEIFEALTNDVGLKKNGPEPEVMASIPQPMEEKKTEVVSMMPEPPKEPEVIKAPRRGYRGRTNQAS